MVGNNVNHNQREERSLRRSGILFPRNFRRNAMTMDKNFGVKATASVDREESLREMMTEGTSWEVGVGGQLIPTKISRHRATRPIHY
jgi:hypothetical protein